MKLSVLTCKIKHYLADFRVVFFVWLIMAIIPWLRNRCDLALIIFAFIITSMSPSDLFPREIWRQLIKPYSLKALPVAIIWFKLIYEMMTKDYDLATAQIMRTQANVMQ